jgi:hypothetical protein
MIPVYGLPVFCRIQKWNCRSWFPTGHHLAAHRAVVDQPTVASSIEKRGAESFVPRHLKEAKESFFVRIND